MFSIRSVENVVLLAQETHTLFRLQTQECHRPSEATVLNPNLISGGEQTVEVFIVSNPHQCIQNLLSLTM